jgi:DMSO/TMAO reductase YedYZ molybdopterin-dependent catalytic subunit
MRRDGIRPPKFADTFALLDFEAEPMPVISLYPIPEPLDVNELLLTVCGLDCKPRLIAWRQCAHLPRVRLRAPLICSIFNWAEVVEWEGVRLRDFLEYVGVTVPPEAYLGLYARDGHYFETLPATMAQDPRTLLATGLNGQPLPLAHGGPLRLVVPFLQGYKSVKWLSAIRVFRHDPAGIKRLLGQSKTGSLGRAWLERYGIEQPEDANVRAV